MVILNQVPWLARVDKERRMTHDYISYKILNIETKYSPQGPTRVLFATNPGEIIIVGLDVLLQLVILSMKTLPCLSSALCP
jgi:hypothetical protein